MSFANREIISVHVGQAGVQLGRISVMVSIEVCKNLNLKAIIFGSYFVWNMVSEMMVKYLR